MTRASNPVVPAFTAWIEALARALSAPTPSLGPSAWKGGRLVTRLAGKPLSLPLSAPNTVVAVLWANHKAAYLAAREQPAGAWNRIVTLTRCEGDVQARYLDIVAALHAVGATGEAQLAWMQARTIQDTADRKDGLFGTLFGKPPRAATITTARSEAALLERLLPFATAKSAVERMIAADGIRENASGAAFEVTGPRRAKLTAAVDKAITALTDDREPCIADAARLARLTWASALAFRA